MVSFVVDSLYEHVSVPTNVGFGTTIIPEPEMCSFCWVNIRLLSSYLYWCLLTPKLFVI